MQRFKLENQWDPLRQEWQPITRPDMSGKWCLYSDVEKLQQEVEQLRASNDTKGMLLKEAEEEIQQLKEHRLEQEQHFHVFTENLKKLGVDSSLVMEAITQKTEWSREWPTKPGFYWAYGEFDYVKEIRPVMIEQHTEEGALFFYPSGESITVDPATHKLVWTPANLPDTAGAVALLEGGE